jgi:hypothetical protein
LYSCEVKVWPSLAGSGQAAVPRVPPAAVTVVPSNVQSGNASAVEPGQFVDTM